MDGEYFLGLNYSGQIRQVPVHGGRAQMEAAHTRCNNEFNHGTNYVCIRQQA